MRARRTTVVAAFALVATAAAATPADAHYLSSTQAVPDRHLNLLRFPPRNPGFRPCISRTVNLRAREFVHGAYIVHERHRTDPDLLQAVIRIRVPGAYQWQACRGYSTRIGHYQVRSTLRGHGFSHTVLNTFKRDPNQLTGRSHLYGNGYYDWGGRIARYTPGVTEPSSQTSR